MDSASISPTGALEYLWQSWTRHYVMYTLLVAGAWIVLRIFYQLILYPRFLSPLRSVPGPPLGSVLYGQVGAILRGEAGIPQRQWAKEYGPVVRVVGPVGIERLIFLNPSALQKIMVSDWIDYPRPKFMRDVLGFATGYGLLTVTGNEHKQMRKAMNPAFSIPNLMFQTQAYYDPIESLVDILRSIIDSEEKPENGKVVTMYDWMSKVTLDIICETAFGYKTDSLHNPHNELAEAYESLLERQSGENLAVFIGIMLIPGVPRILGSDWVYNHRFWIAKIPGLDDLRIMIEGMRKIRKISADMLAEKMRDSAVVSETGAKSDIMSLCLRAREQPGADKENGGYVMSNQTMMDQVLTFLGAGHETTASGLAWTLWLLAKDKVSQDKLREEVFPVFSGNQRPDYRTVKDLEWLDCVIMESLRVLPPVPMTFRMTGKTDYIDGVLVPKGTLLYVPIRVANTWKEFWGEDAEEFNPSRWLNHTKGSKMSSSLLSFIIGPHACIGKTMAIMEMKIVLGSLIANFEFEPSSEDQVPLPTAAITMKPKDNMPLRIRKVNMS